MIVLSSSFTGGPQYMHRWTQNALIYVHIMAGQIYLSLSHVMEGGLRNFTT